MKLRKGDTVKVVAGGNSKKNNDKGKIGEILKVNAKDNTVVVEGVNIVTKAKRARTAQEKSELVKQEAAIDVSNVNVVCPSCGKAVRVKHAIVDGKKVRVCACGASLDKKFVKDAKVKKAAKTAETAEQAKAEKPAKTEKKSRVTKSANVEEKATKAAVAKKPTTSRSAQRGV